MVMRTTQSAKYLLTRYAWLVTGNKLVSFAWQRKFLQSQCAGWANIYIWTENQWSDRQNQNNSWNKEMDKQMRRVCLFFLFFTEISIVPRIPHTNTEWTISKVLQGRYLDKILKIFRYLNIQLFILHDVLFILQNEFKYHCCTQLSLSNSILRILLLIKIVWITMCK